MIEERLFEPDAGLCPECGAADVDLVILVGPHGVDIVRRTCWQCGWKSETDLEAPLSDLSDNCDRDLNT